MGLILALVACGIALCGFFVLRARSKRQRNQLDAHQITAEELRKRMDSGEEVLVFDVRQPLDLLANSELIRGAKRIPPRELLANPSLIPKERDAVFYCT